MEDLVGAGLVLLLLASGFRPFPSFLLPLFRSFSCPYLLLVFFFLRYQYPHLIFFLFFSLPLSFSFTSDLLRLSPLLSLYHDGGERVRRTSRPV